MITKLTEMCKFYYWCGGFDGDIEHST